MSIVQEQAIADVLTERARQDAKWGEQNLDPFAYLTVLVEEVGEFARAVIDMNWGGPAAGSLRAEAVQVAAVALAIVECLDRAKWTWPDRRRVAKGEEVALLAPDPASIARAGPPATPIREEAP
jgi:NTP pyrophosphatase (non-canonical NTP hydrolase)